MNGADNRKTRGDGDGPFRPRPVHSRDDESRIRQRRNIDKGRHGPTSAIRTQAVIDASLSTGISGLFRLITTTTIRGRWVGHCLTLPALVPRAARVWTFV